MFGISTLKAFTLNSGKEVAQISMQVCFNIVYFVVYQFFLDFTSSKKVNEIV